MMRMSMWRRRDAAAALFLCALLAACGGGSDSTAPAAPVAPADPLAPYMRQSVEWQGCDTSDEVMAGIVRDYGAAVACGTVRVPLDYADPARGELTLPLLRIAAGGGAPRLGSILFNPGGPGADGYLSGVDLADLIVLGNPEDPTGGRLKEMAARYDLVGFSPRGIGHARQLSCRIARSELQLPDPTADALDDQNIARSRHNDKLLADACAADPLAPFVNTDATARDLDLIRAALGEDKLNYIGYSYGTRLGLWYATLFPQRVGKMLVDSTVDVSTPDGPYELTAPAALQHVMDDIVAPWAAQYGDDIDVGNDADAVCAILPSAPRWARDNLGYELVGNLAVRWQSDEVLAILAALRGITQIDAAHPQLQAQDWEPWLAAHVFALDPDRNARALDYARAAVAAMQPTPESLFAESVLDVPGLQPSDPIVIGNELAVRNVIRCNDTPKLGLPFWLDYLRNAASHGPWTALTMLSTPCEYWPHPVRAMPPLATANSASPILMTQSEFDTRTPADGAQRTFAVLGDARMVMVKGDYTHGVFPYGTACADAPVAEYFLTGALPPRYQECAGILLPEPDGALMSRSLRGEPGRYVDAEAAQRVLERMHRRIR